MSSAKPMTRDALRPGAGSSSYIVTTGRGEPKRCRPSRHSRPARFPACARFPPARCRSGGGVRSSRGWSEASGAGTRMPPPPPAAAGKAEHRPWPPGRRGGLARDMLHDAALHARRWPGHGGGWSYPSRPTPSSAKMFSTGHRRVAWLAVSGGSARSAGDRCNRSIDWLADAIRRARQRPGWAGARGCGSRRKCARAPGRRRAPRYRRPRMPLGARGSSGSRSSTSDQLIHRSRRPQQRSMRLRKP
jgi:hypothetical protein